MKKLLKKLSNNDQQLIVKAIKYYLNNRPTFYGLIRPQELYLFYYFRNYLSDQVLDYGHGDGFFAKFLVETFHQKIAVGLDIENSRIKESIALNCCEKTIIYDGKNIPIQNNYFKSVISNCVLEHLDDLGSSLKEINRVLKPGGYFCTSVMTNNWEKYLLGKKVFGKIYLKYLARKQNHINLLSAKQWQNFFKKNNFTVEQEVGYLNQKNVGWLELFHYLSIFSLLAKKLTNKWVLIEDGCRTSLLTNFFYRIVRESLFCDIKSTSAIFYVLKKNK